LPITEAVVITDSALHARRITMDQLRARVNATAKFRRVIELAEPASESPMESRLRMVLVLGGLPRPKAQVPVHDRDGRFVARTDLFYERQRLAIEFDGAVHRTTLVADNRRQNQLFNAGVDLLRFTGADVLGDPASVVAQVRLALRRHLPSSRDAS
jgi:very-short-patch-repair endonuclease